MTLYISKEKEMNIRYISRLEPDYPEKLRLIPQPPAGIYVKGSLPDPGIPTVAIIGSRICSQYGRICAQEFGRELALAGVQIVSGLARGIDCIAQDNACMAGGASFGILGCGVNIVYPVQNKPIFDKVLEKGGLISEYHPDAPPLRPYFAERNRIISALCDILLVIEAGKMRGTQITVRHALEQGKDMYAVPGRIHDICSTGCNEMISQGAGIALDSDTILQALGVAAPKDTNPKSSSRKGEPKKDAKLRPLEKLEKKVYDSLDYYPESLDSLSRKCRLPVSELSNILFHLMIKGYVKEEGKNNYLRLY